MKQVNGPALFEGPGFEVRQSLVFDGVRDLEGVATDLTVLDVGDPVTRGVQHHGNHFTAKWTGERMFHDDTVSQMPIA